MGSISYEQSGALLQHVGCDLLESGRLQRLSIGERRDSTSPLYPHRFRRWSLPGLVLVEMRQRARAMKLTQVRHGAVAEPPNPCRFSLGDRRVCTTFRKRLQTFWKTEAELVKQAFLFERRFRDPAEADLASIRRGQYDVGALQSGQQSQHLHRR